ncbi:MAG: URC4/urg3 family protein [Pseudolabrys sp.]
MSLLSAGAVRERAGEILEVGLTGELAHFRVDVAKLAPTADFVAKVIRENYPDLKVPLHARWRHFVFEGRELWAEIASRVFWPDAKARARAEFDLAIVSVLLDAGAGPTWRYRDTATGLHIGRSEGLALASLRMFEAGLFSANANDPLRADAEKLAALTGEDLARGFSVTNVNPMTGLEGRAALLQRLGRAIQANPQAFAINDTARAGGLFDLLSGQTQSAPPAPDILRALLMHLGAIWPDRLTLGGITLGDCWHHSAIKRDDATNGLMPLHKLSQWLSYSLIEPLQRAGLTVTDIDGLTGLAEYRNGGLFIDSGVIALRDEAQAARPHAVDSELVVEWRALTVALLDRLLAPVRDKLGVAAQDFPLGALLEGGTWAAGRRLACERRADSGPPLAVLSDGTVF